MSDTVKIALFNRPSDNLMTVTESEVIVETLAAAADVDPHWLKDMSVSFANPVDPLASPLGATLITLVRKIATYGVETLVIPEIKDPHDGTVLQKHMEYRAAGLLPSLDLPRDVGAAARPIWIQTNLPEGARSPTSMFVTDADIAGYVLAEQHRLQRTRGDR